MDLVGLKRAMKFMGESNGSGGIEKELEGGNGVDLSNTLYACMKFSNF